VLTRRARRAQARGHRDRSHDSGATNVGTPMAPSPRGLLEELEGGSGVALGKVVGGEAHQGGLSMAAGGDEVAQRGSSTVAALW
jgi:hypothetical protein